MKNFFQFKAIRHYLFSYLLLFFLPLIALNVLFHFHFQRTLQDELIRNQQTSLEKFQISVESEMSKFGLISNQITVNGNATSFELSSNPLKGMRLIQFLNSQKNVNPFLSDIVIYYSDDDRFYSSTSSYTPEYFQMLYKNQPDALKDLSAFFESPQSHIFPPRIISL